MILSQLKTAQLEARKAKETLKATLLTTIIGEVETVGKNKRNGAPTADEVVEVLKKFKKGMKETLKYLAEWNTPEDDVRVTTVVNELQILNGFLPEQLSDLQVQKDIGTVMQQLNLAKEQKSMGPVVKALREKYGEQFDGGQVNTQFKALIA